MRVANIVPPQWEGLFSKGRYCMALAHWVIKDDNYVKKLRRVMDRYIILDNGIFEGEQLQHAKLAEACAKLGADEVVLPDMRGEPKVTLKKSAQHLGQTSARRVMFVPQATDLGGWFQCLDKWLEHWADKGWDKIYSLALGVTAPRVSLQDLTPQPGMRVAVLNRVSEYGYPLHMLGVNNPEEFVKLELPVAHECNVRGVDTSLAFALGAEGVLLTPTAKKIHLGPPDQYEHLTTDQRRLIHLNQRILTEWCTAGEGDDRIHVHWIRQTASKWLKYYAQGFTSIEEVMNTCGMQEGKYAMLKLRGKEKYIRPLLRGMDLKGFEVEVILR